MFWNMSHCRKPTPVLVVFFSIFLFPIVVSGNIESNGDGGYCINKIPRRGIPANCTSDTVCEDLLNIAVQEGQNNLRCGDQGECITKVMNETYIPPKWNSGNGELPRNEQCTEACDGSPCGKFCLQEHETKVAVYCIETRDHPNAMPNSTVLPPNKYFCTCVIPDEYHRHRVVSRYLPYE